MISLGIETSCDETSVAIVNDKKEILSHIILSQSAHEIYGGVVPEIAARSHMDVLDKIIIQSLREANISLKEIDIIGVTSGPGLIGGLIVGVTMAKALASAIKKPIIEINHLEAHGLVAKMSSELQFPFLLVLVSGGHCQIVIAEDLGKYKVIGRTIDDALGEAFDKVAKMMGLSYPGGPIIEQYASLGNNSRFNFPRSMIDRDDCNFSFSGLKTAVKREIDKIGILDEQTKYDIAASFQTTVTEILANKLSKAIDIFKNTHPEAKDVVIAGGVAANKFIYENLKIICEKNNVQLYAPPLKLCTDNGAMVAWAALERFRRGYKSNLNFAPRPRWPLEELST